MASVIERGDSRSVPEQVEAVLGMLSGSDLSEKNHRKLSRSIRYYWLAICSQSGWGDEHLLKTTRNFVDTLNEMQSASGGTLISAQVSESLCNFIHNVLAVGEYSGTDSDPTKPWREW